MEQSIDALELEEINENDIEEIEKQYKQFNKNKLDNISIRIALTGIFISLSVVLGYLLATIPNLELFTATIFLSGFVLRKKDGIVVGALSSFIFCGFNPMGASNLPLLSYQIFHYALVGFLGGILSNFFAKKSYFDAKKDMYVWQVILAFGMCGFMLTFMYQILSSFVGYAFVFGTSESFFLYFMTGISFTIVHLVGNTLVFIFVLPTLVRQCARIID